MCTFALALLTTAGVFSRSLFDLHRIPRVRAVQWFKDKRAGRDVSRRQAQKADGADEWHGGSDKEGPQDM